MFVKLFAFFSVLITLIAVLFVFFKKSPFLKKKLLTQLSSVKNISVKEELSLGVGQKLILVAFRDRDILLSSSKGELRVVDSIASEEPKWQYEKKLGEREHRYEV